MIKAVYRAREDGDYDFVAAFATEHDYINSSCSWVCDKELIVKDFDDLTHLVDVLEVSHD